MAPPHSTDAAAPRTDPFRWDRPTRAQAHDHFHDPGHDSQRAYAREHGIPRSTLGAWLRDDGADDSDLEPDVRALFRSAAGQRFLRRLVLALYLVFVFGGACGLRRLALFLRRTGLDGFVASSTGALHELAQILQAHLGVFAEEEQPRLAEGMTHRHIALVPDENFHGDQVCLVAAEPVSNFLVVEQYAERRDAVTWTQAIQQGVAGLPVTVLLITSDQAKGLIACADQGLEAWHLPELFHGQRDLCQPLMGPLERQQESAQKALQQAQEVLQGWQEEAARAQAGPARPGRPLDYAGRIALSAALVEGCTRKVEACAARQEQAREAVRGLGDDYHPFDRRTGAVVDEAEVQKRLEERLQTLEQVAQEAGLGGKAPESLARGQRWVTALVATMAWFWGVARACVEELDLPAEVERAMDEALLPGLYWQQGARRARTAEEGRHQATLAERRLRAAWAEGGVLRRLAPEDQERVRRVSQEVVGLFARSSSCVEGRNGRLSLFHHGQTRLSAARLKALTVMHNYVSERADGTTAAERFFGKKPRDVFGWLLERLPDLPRPAARRPKPVRQATAKAGEGWPD